LPHSEQNLAGLGIECPHSTQNFVSDDEPADGVQLVGASSAPGAASVGDLVAFIIV
jgi:hypothetical protein